MGAANISVATNGTCHVAPYGTTLPTTAQDAETLNVAFEDCGEISQDGLDIEYSTNGEVIRNWSGVPIRALNKESSTTFKLTFLEARSEVVENLYWGSTVTSQLGDQSRILIGQADTTPQSFIIATIDNADDSVTTYVIPRGVVSERGTISEKSDGATQFEVTITALYDSTLGACVSKLFDNDLTS